MNKVTLWPDHDYQSRGPRTLPGNFTEQDIREEAQLSQADPGFAEQAGPITRAFLDSVPWMHEPGVVIDSRAHMLMRGWYPCVPGYHLDSVPRNTETGQPELINRFGHKHVLCVIDPAKTYSCPAWLINKVSLEIDPKRVYGHFHEQLEKQSYTLYGDRVLVAFTSGTLHRGTPALKSGWRFFIRASKDHRTALNEVRTQTQVYLPPEYHGGW